MSKTHGPMWQQIAVKPLRWGLYLAAHHESGPVGKDLPMIEIRYVPSQRCWKARSWTLGREEILISESDGESVGHVRLFAQEALARWLREASQIVESGGLFVR